MPTARQYDAAIITVLQVELDAVLDALKADRKARVRQKDGGIFYKAKIYSNLLDRQLSLLITCIGKDGQAMASARTTSVIEQFDPTILILVGIAAGMRGKLRIGDIIVPRSVVDLSSNVRKNDSTEFRPRISELPFPIQQMIPGFNFKQSIFHERCREYFGPPVAPPQGDEKTYETDVTFTPRVADDALASADSLLKIDTAFPEMQRYHEKIRAAEMEAGGFIIACSGRTHPSPWIVIRGISDFGDTFKDDYFHRLAASATAAWLTMFLEDGLDLVVLRPNEDAATHAPDPASNAQPNLIQTTGHLPPVVTDVINSQLERFSLASTFDRQRDLEELREEWRICPSGSVLEKVRALKKREDWPLAAAETRAKILRFEATLETSLNANLTLAEEIIATATTLDPKLDTESPRGLIAFYRDKDAALELLSSPATQESWNLRIGFLAERKEWDRVLAETQTPPPGLSLDPEGRRLRALGLLHTGKRAEARAEVNKALEERPNWFHLRRVDAVIAFFESLSEPLFISANKNWPQPMEPALVSRDKATLENLYRAEQILSELCAVPGMNLHVRLDVEGWRLGCLGNHPERENEAKSFCATLLGQNPTHPVALAWATARDYAGDLQASADALFHDLVGDNDK